MILGHEGCAEVVEVGELVKDFKPGDRVLVPAITPDWNSLEAQAGFSIHSGGMLAGWKFSNFKDGVFSEFFHVNDADGNLALLPSNINTVDACMLSDMVPTGFHGAELADVQYGDSVLVIGIGPVGLMSVAGAALRGASRINVNYLGEGESIAIPRTEWGVGMGHKLINGGLIPGGRLRMEKLGSLVAAGKLDLGPLSTHVFNGFDHIEEALFLMRDKPADLIKPVVKLED